MADFSIEGMAEYTNVADNHDVIKGSDVLTILAVQTQQYFIRNTNITKSRPTYFIEYRCLFRELSRTQIF